MLKRSLDLLIALPLLVLAGPVIVLMAVAIRCESPGNPFFVQIRVGRGGQLFSMWKMRSLFADKFVILAWEQELDSRDSRITRVGRFIRRTKLDELPQLWHVVSGRMSLVGPRPDIPEQAAQYSTDQRQRLLAKPGMTGVVQISGNTCRSWPIRIELDRWYVREASLRLDLQVLAWTMLAIWTGESQPTDPLGAAAETLPQTLEEDPTRSVPCEVPPAATARRGTFVPAETSTCPHES